MFDRLRSRLTYANVMATIAVVGMLVGGGAYAASKIGASDIAERDSLETHQEERRQEIEDRRRRCRRG